MSAQSQEYPHMTVEEFLAFEEVHPEGKYEYIDGYLRDLGALLMAGGTLNHAQITTNISTALNIALRSRERTCRVFSSDARFRSTKTRYFYPDVSVKCDPKDAMSQDILEFPCLVVEVLSPSTALFDHTEKLEAYKACPSIQEYLLVDTTRQFVEVYHRMSNGNLEYADYREGDTITLNGLGVALTVADCYYGISFE